MSELRRTTSPGIRSRHTKWAGISDRDWVWYWDMETATAIERMCGLHSGMSQPELEVRVRTWVVSLVSFKSYTV